MLPDVLRTVAVAIDAPGPAGARSYTYHLPPALSDLRAGEAVLVEFARRQALAIVLGDAQPPLGVETKPVRERVRTDGPLLPPLTLELARWVSEHYLAPPALTIRAALPPGLLGRLELVAERTSIPIAHGSSDPETDTLLASLEAGPRPVRDLPAPDGRPALLRRLRTLAAEGLLTTEWTLTAAGAGPRYVRWLAASDAGRAAVVALDAGERPGGRPLGPRQLAALRELVAASAEGLPGSEVAAHHGHGPVAGLVRRGMVEATIRERERRPLERRAVGRRGARPEGTALTGPQAEAVGLIRKAIHDRDATPLLLDGVTAGGKTTVYVEAIATSLEAGRPALVLVPEIALALPLVDRLRADLRAEVALLHSALGEGERADEWRRIRAGDADVVVGTRLGVLAPLADLGLVVVDEEHEATYKSDRTPRLQARDVAIQLGVLAGAAVVLGSATPAVDTVGHARAGWYRRVRLPVRASGRPPTVEVVDLRAELAAGNRGLLSGRLADALSGLATERGKRAILVINRRGSASVVLCRDCGSAQACPECERPLVYHQTGNTLRCHHCGTATPLATRCPSCASPRIRYLGGGTERVEREVRRRFDAIEVDRLRVKPMVKITGEFYLQTVEGEPNYNIHRWLESEGAAVYPAAITIWLDYLLRLAGQEFEDHIGIERAARLKLGGIRAAQGLLRWTYGRMRRALAGVPHEMPDQYTLRELAAPYYHSRLNGGEGDMLVGKALWAHRTGKAHMICELSPYSCMPNTMSIGAMAAVLGKYPDLLYAPLEIKGDAEVHALSRCQMILTEAKKRAQREYEQVLERTGFDEASLRAAVDARPELRRATTRVPHYGVAGSAANLALHLAAERR